MNRTDRLLGILVELQARGQLTSRQLAARFEVAPRTILRDLDALGELGVPLVALHGRGGGYRLLEGFFLPPQVFTPGEAAALLERGGGGNRGGTGPGGTGLRSRGQPEPVTPIVITSPDQDSAQPTGVDPAIGLRASSGKQWRTRPRLTRKGEPRPSPSQRPT